MARLCELNTKTRPAGKFASEVVQLWHTHLRLSPSLHVANDRFSYQSLLFPVQLWGLPPARRRTFCATLRKFATDWTLERMHACIAELQKAARTLEEIRTQAVRRELAPLT